jgi:pyruvate,orthophosphate dikinase
VQLHEAVKAVFRRLETTPGDKYRHMNNYRHMGTAVTSIPWFSATGDDSRTGVAFTRDPGTGEKELYGNPYERRARLRRRNAHRRPRPARQTNPKVSMNLWLWPNKHESHYRYADMEFT